MAGPNLIAIGSSESAQKALKVNTKLYPFCNWQCLPQDFSDSVYWVSSRQSWQGENGLVLELPVMCTLMI